jgi:signal transduction histidine kinase
MNDAPSSSDRAPSPAEAADDGRWVAALARCMARVTANADREGVLAALAGGLVEEFDAALARIFLYDPADDALQLRCSAGLPEAEHRLPPRLPLSGTSLLVVQAIAKNEVIAVDPIGPGTGVHDPEWLIGQGVRAYAGFPLGVGGRKVGAMSVFVRRPWTAALLHVLQALAQQAALALDHARTIEESHALQVVAAEIAAARDPADLMNEIVRRTMATLGADAGALWMSNDDGSVRVEAQHGFSELFRRALTGARLTPAGPIYEEIRRTGRPVATRDDNAVLRERNIGMADAFRAEGLVSAIRLPLFGAGREVVGMLALYHRRERVYSEAEVQLAQAFTDQAAVALHNARLMAQEHAARQAAARQVERLDTLAGITRRLLAAPQLEDIFDVVVDAAGRLCDAAGAMVSLLDPDERIIRVAAHRGPVERLVEQMRPGVQVTPEYLAMTATGRALSTNEAVVVEDFSALPRTSNRQATLDAGVRAFVVAPLRLDGRPIGLLWVTDTRPRGFEPSDVALVQALADQAALAIGHARLATRDQEAAVLEERARLARDLHDSVTQTIFSLGMLARAAQAQQQRGAAALPGTLDRIAALATDALAEMRALLFELRPGALVEEGLTAALAKLVAAVQVRSDVPVTFMGESSARLGTAAETAVFRIVQEALNNAVKHARASAIAVAVREEDGRLVVTVHDDGIGFEPGGGGGGLGMATMRERAAATGIGYRCVSTSGAGTTITVDAPLPVVATASAEEQ